MKPSSLQEKLNIKIWATPNPVSVAATAAAAATTAVTAAAAAPPAAAGAVAGAAVGGAVATTSRDHSHQKTENTMIGGLVNTLDEA